VPKSHLGVGIIGVSPVRAWAATAHIPAVRALPDYEIRALSGHRAESARGAGEAFGIRQVFSDHEQLVTQPDIDLVAVNAAFAADIDNETHTVPDFADALRRHKVLAAIKRSAATGEKVKT
jgi:predicted dehydrogenase